MRDNGFVKALALASQLGFAVACPLVVFIAGGVWADDQLGTRPWLFFLGLLVGVVAAGYALFQIAAVGGKRRTEPSARRAPDKIERDDGGQGGDGDHGDLGTNHASNERRQP